MRLVREDGGKTLHSIRIVHTSRSTFEVGQVIVAATVLGGMSQAEAGGMSYCSSFSPVMIYLRLKKS